MNKYKVILLGSYFVGKTSITNKYIYNTFSNATYTTIGASYYSKQMTLNNINVVVEYWDTCSNERYAPIIPMFYKNTDVAIIVYDVTSVGSFNKCIKSIEDIRRHIEDVKIILVGNKIDLEREIKTKDGQLFANHHGVMFKECSAATGEGVKELFELVHETIKPMVTEKVKTNNIVLHAEKKQSCCF